MSADPPQPPGLPDTTRRRLDRLEELAEIGMDVARGQRRWALASEGEAGCVEVAMAFARTSRAVRLTDGLAERIEQDHAAVATAEAAAREAPRDASIATSMGGPGHPYPPGGVRPDFKARMMKVIGARLRVAVRKDEVRYVVERSIAAAPRAEGERLDTERWAAAVDERMEAESDTGWLDRPMGEIAAAICRDLGVRFEPDLWMVTGDRKVDVNGHFEPLDEDEAYDGPDLWPPSDDGVRRGFADFRPSTALGVYTRYGYELKQRQAADTS